MSACHYAGRAEREKSNFLEIAHCVSPLLINDCFRVSLKESREIIGSIHEHIRLMTPNIQFFWSFRLQKYIVTCFVAIVTCSIFLSFMTYFPGNNVRTYVHLQALQHPSLVAMLQVQLEPISSCWEINWELQKCLVVIVLLVDFGFCHQPALLFLFECCKAVLVLEGTVPFLPHCHLPLLLGSNTH